MKKNHSKSKKGERKQTLFKRLFPTFISSLPHHKKIFRKAVIYTFYIASGLFLCFNIFLSQQVSNLFFQIINDDQKASVSYLQSIKNLPQFPTELSRLTNQYGNDLKNEVYHKEIEQNVLIQKYELLLRKNLLSRDILYSLFLLYNQKGNKEVAQKYFEKAIVVDPTLR